MDFLRYIDFHAQSAMGELLRGNTINPYDRHARSSLSKYVRLGIVTKFGKRYPNTKFSINLESDEIKCWLQLWSGWKEMTDAALQAQNLVRITPEKLDS